MNTIKKSRRTSLRLVLAAALAVWACGDSNAPPQADSADPQVVAALAAGDGWCVPDMIYSDGLGGLNALATDRRFMTLGECDPPPTEDPYPDSAGIWIYGWEPSECFNISWDIDNDGVHNGCENALAQAFAPLLLMPHDCNWDHSPGFDRMGGEYYFAVQRASPYSDTLRLAYLPAYYWDCGTAYDFISLCTAVHGLGLSYCTGHSGDSEFMLVDVKYDAVTSHWLTQRVFLSAHCNTLAGGNCDWYATPNFQWKDGRLLGAPEIWVAYGKHANYYSQNECNGGSFGWDECSYSTAEQVFPVVYAQQNIGSRATPLRDCAPAFSGSPETGSWEECMWSKPFPMDRFNGWQFPMYNNGSDPYTDHLSQYAGF